MKIFNLLLLCCIFLSSPFGYANQCTQVFPNGLQTYAPGSNIRFSCGTQLVNNSSAILSTISITNPASSCTTKTCGTVDCVAAGSLVNTLNLGSFQTSNNAGGNISFSGTLTLGGNNNTTTDYRNLTVGSGNTLNFSSNPNGNTVYRFRDVNISNGGIVNLQPGDYWFRSLTVSGSAVINVVGTGTARLYVNNAVSTGTAILTFNATGPASKLLLYGYSSLAFGGSTSVIKGIVYANSTVTLNNNIIVTGAMTGANIILNNTADVIYDSTAVTNMDFGVTCPATAKFLINAPSTGNYCQNMTVSAAAQTSNNQTIAGYSDQVTLSTQTGFGNWVSTTGAGILSSTVNGVATYQFVAGDNGTASFQLSYPNTGSTPITIRVSQTNNNNVFGLSGPISFSPANLLVTATPIVAPQSPPPAFNAPQVAGNNFTLYLTAYSGSSCGIATNYTGSKNIRFWTNYLNPATGTLNAKINGVNIANSAMSPQTTQSITFTNGVATVTGSYPDVGQLSLNVVDTASGGPTGQTGDFVIKPAQFVINIPNNTAAQVASPVANAISACLNNTVFAKAGEPFTVNVQVRNSEGIVTPNYGNETPSQGILLKSSALVAPNPGRNGSTNLGTIGNGTAFIRTTGTGFPFLGTYFTGSNFYFDEVGCIQLTASVATGSYLGAGDVNVSRVVGRFIPNHFSVAGNTPIFTTGCSSGFGSFTYLDQIFNYSIQPVLTVTAQSLLNTTTQNYTGSFWKLLNTSFISTYNKQFYPVNSGNTIPNLTLSTPNPTPTFLDLGNGTGTFTFASNSGFKIQRTPSVIVPPFLAEIQLIISNLSDPDGVSCMGNGCVAGGFAFGSTNPGGGIHFTGTHGGKQFYHGRLTIENATGAQQIALTVPMRTEVYTTANGGNGFALNSLDYCTVYNSASHLLLTPSSGLNTTVSLFGVPPTFFGGILNITLSPSTPPASGYVDIDAVLDSTSANLPWLQYNWPYSGTIGTNFSQNPRGRATFGIFKGNDRIIYQQEIIE